MPSIVVVAASAGRALSGLAEITAARAAGAFDAGVALPLVFISSADRASLRPALANPASPVVPFVALGHGWASLFCCHFFPSEV